MKCGTASHGRYADGRRWFRIIIRWQDVSQARDGTTERFDGYDLLVNPIVLVEVLSQTTHKRDRAKKFEEYKSIGSLREYLLVSQSEPLVTLHSKQPDGSRLETRPSGLDGEIHLPSMDCLIRLRDLYRNVVFPTSKP